MKICHQQAANINDCDIEFIFGENIIYRQIANAYLEYAIKIEKDVVVAANGFLVNGDAIRLVNNAFDWPI